MEDSTSSVDVDVDVGGGGAGSNTATSTSGGVISVSVGVGLGVGIGIALGIGLGIITSKSRARQRQQERERDRESERHSASASLSAAAPALAAPENDYGGHDFTGSVVIVTGGAGGIGRGVAIAFARCGARVVVADVDRNGGKTLPAEVEHHHHDDHAAPGAIEFRFCDAANSASIESFCQYVLSKYGRVDVLVNNVGIQVDDGNPVHALTEKLWDLVMDVNVKSYFLFSKHCIPSMLERKQGVIVNMASVQGLQSMRGIPAYASSKGAILSLTRQMSMDYASQGIRVTAICPGTIRTPLVDKLFKERGKGDSTQAWKEAASIYPMKRVGEISEIAKVCLFLASSQASFITGEHIVVDGGIMAKGGWADSA